MNMTTTLSLRPDRFTQERAMTSIDLLEVVNQARAMHGESEIRRNDFTARCRDELDGENYETFVVKNPNGTASEATRMTRDQCMYVLMRESKAVRRTATEQLNKQAKPAFALPDFTNPAAAARAWADAVEATQALAIERDHAIATKAQIGNRREATAMATASAARKEAVKLKDQLGFNARHATVRVVEKAMSEKFAWLPLRKWCSVNGVRAKDVPDPLYTTVKAWPAAAWSAVYGIDLHDLFGASE